MLELTTDIVEKNRLTTIMITHNMKDAIAIGNRLIMMNDGKIIYDVSGEEKKKLTTADLLEKFKITSGSELDKSKKKGYHGNPWYPFVCDKNIMYYLIYLISLPSSTSVEYSPAMRLVIRIS